MKIHIVGSGPTGMSLAWEILRSGEHDVTLYDRKVSEGVLGGNLIQKHVTYTHIELYLIRRL